MKNLIIISQYRFCQSYPKLLKSMFMRACLTFCLNIIYCIKVSQVSKLSIPVKLIYACMRLTNGKMVGSIVLIDFKKAFDLLDHDILLNKLKIYGTKGEALLWFDTYLTNSKQQIAINKQIRF